MWTRRDAANILALAAVVLAVGLMLFPPVARPATLHRPSPARWVWKQIHAPRGTLVSVSCRRARPGYLCALDVQRNVHARFCWWVGLIPAAAGWHVVGLQPIATAHCPRLRLVQHGLRALRA